MSGIKKKVLIVDDEHRIGMLIRKLVHWEELNIACLDVVDNGEVAYELIRTKHPEIVITDIRMPKMNGLDLIELSREEMGTKFIVVSGYKEFDYAHRALQYGVTDYLLKPIDEVELNMTLRKICNELVTENEEKEEQRELIRTLTANEQIIKRELFHNILDQEKVPSLKEMEETYNVFLDAPIYRGIDVKLDYTDYRKTDQKQDKITIEKVIHIIGKHLEGKIKEELICEKEQMHIYCLFNYEWSKAKDIKLTIGNLLSEIQEYLIGFEQYTITIGVGKEKLEFGEIRFSIKEAYKAVGHRIKLGTGRLIYAEDVYCTWEPLTIKNLEPSITGFFMAMDGYARKELEQSINGIYSRYQTQEKQDFSQCYEIAKILIESFCDCIGIDDKEGQTLKQKLLAESNHCYSIYQLKKLLKNQLGTYLETRRSVLEIESTRPIRQAKEYIEIHFSKKILLEDIAQVVNLNPVYFSVLFKKETGLNFSSYLLEIRMEHAKKMICESNETIAAIGEKVGYKDTKYFSQLFAKTVGIKPALYRKLHS